MMPGKGYYKKLIRNGELCSYCGKEPATTVDHIMPKKMKGYDVWMNLAGACSHCNSTKAHNSLLGHMLGVDIPGRSEPCKFWIMDGEMEWADPLKTGVTRAERRWI